MKIGELLKQEREKLELSQKEMAGNVLSFSYYSKVERGLYDINVTDLIDILKLHQINIELFFKKIDENSSKNYKSVFIRRLRKAFYRFDVDTILNIKKEIVETNDLNESDNKYLLSIVTEMIAICKNDLSLIDPQTKKILKKKIFGYQVWDEEALNILAMSMLVFQDNELLEIVHLIAKKFTPIYEQPLEVQKLIACIAVNYLHVYILHKYKNGKGIKIIKYILTNLDEIEILGSYKIEARFLLAIIENDEATQKVIKNCLVKCGMNGLVNRLERVNCQL